jgi:hypothetical protein
MSQVSLQRKLLPKPIGTDRGARYTDNHALRAMLIRQPHEQGQTQNEVRSQRNQLSE